MWGWGCWWCCWLCCGWSRSCPCIAEREYLGTVDAVKLNVDFVAVLSEGRLYLHTIIDGPDGNGVSVVLPSSSPRGGPTCVTATPDRHACVTATCVRPPQVSVVLPERRPDGEPQAFSHTRAAARRAPIGRTRP